MKVGEQHSLLLSNHRGFAVVAEQALGGRKGPAQPGKAGVKDLAAGHATPEAAAAAINKALAGR